MPFGFGKKDEGEKPETKFDARYLGGHKMYPKATDTKVLIYKDKVEVEKLNLQVPYTAMTHIENADEKKISAMRVVLLGLIGALWKKKHVYTVIQYIDALNEEQSLVFDFDKDIDKAQPIIYQKMLQAKTNKAS